MNEHERLPTLLDILNDISLNEELILFNKSVFSFLLNNHDFVDKFEVAQTKNGDFILSPIPLLFNTFYRGESAVYEPCKASIFREGMTKERCFIEHVKTSELGLLIDKYPLTHIYREGITLPIINNEDMTCNLTIDYFALAQHYGIKTDLLDFTCDKWVAAFFASTEYKDGKYYPIEDNSKEGTFFIYHAMPDLPGTNSRFRPVGLQPFSRPGEQKGFILQLNEQDNLNNMRVEKRRFRHDKNISHLIFNYCNRANKLFPEDILHDKVEMIKTSTVFSDESLECTKTIFYPDINEHDWRDLITTSGLSFQEKAVVSFTDDELNDFMASWEQTNRSKFLNQLVFRPIFQEGYITEISGSELLEKNKKT